jgi:hypothetical protein
VKVKLVYRRRIYPSGEAAPVPSGRVLVMRNAAADGLGLPLPAGQLMLFSSAGPRPILLGGGPVDDYSVGEDVEVEIGGATGVMAQVRSVAGDAAGRDYELVVTSDRSEAVVFEALIALPPGEVTSDLPIVRRRGNPAISVDIPANGSRTIRFRHNRREKRP